MLGNNKKANAIFTFIAIILLITTWYFLKVQGITMTDASEAEYQSEEEIAVEEISEDELVEEAGDFQEEVASVEETEEISMPEMDFYDKTDDIEVFVHAEAGNFPKDTKMILKEVSEEDTKGIVNEVTSDEIEVKDIIAVDITFYDVEEKEIEPINSFGVHVILKPLKEIEGENKEIFHVRDTGETEKIADMEEDVAEFDSVGFSIYAIVGTDGKNQENEKPRRTYIFFVDGEEWNRQIVKNGDTLYAPTVENEYFDDWYIGDTETKLTFGTISDIPETEGTLDEEIIVNARFFEKYTVTFYDDYEVVKSTASGKVRRYSIFRY